MPRPRVNREVPRTTGITVELSDYGLFLQATEPDGQTYCAFLPARTLRQLVLAPVERRQQALAQLDRDPPPPPPHPRRPRNRG
jgi:hypothetical protein